MKKKAVKIVSIAIIAILLSSCDKKEPKINQSSKTQIQKEDESLNQADSGTPVENNFADINPDNTLDSGSIGNISKVSELISDDLLSDEMIELEEDNKSVDADENIDVDLTKLSSTMVYSEVYNMMYAPEEYIGKTVKMSGMFVAYTNQDESQFYPAVIISDATACCSQGLEFILEGNPDYPEGYPEMETDITVMGTFETYEEDGSMFCRLKNAKLVG